MKVTCIIEATSTVKPLILMASKTPDFLQVREVRRGSKKVWEVDIEVLPISNQWVYFAGGMVDLRRGYYYSSETVESAIYPRADLNKLSEYSPFLLSDVMTATACSFIDTRDTGSDKEKLEALFILLDKIRQYYPYTKSVYVNAFTFSSANVGRNEENFYHILNFIEQNSSFGRGPAIANVTADILAGNPKNLKLARKVPIVNPSYNKAISSLFLDPFRRYLVNLAINRDSDVSRAFDTIMEVTKNIDKGGEQTLTELGSSHSMLTIFKEYSITHDAKSTPSGRVNVRVLHIAPTRGLKLLSLVTRKLFS